MSGVVLCHLLNMRRVNIVCWRAALSAMYSASKMLNAIVCCFWEDLEGRDPNMNWT